MITCWQPEAKTILYLKSNQQTAGPSRIKPKGRPIVSDCSSKSKKKKKKKKKRPDYRATKF